MNSLAVVGVGVLLAFANDEPGRLEKFLHAGQFAKGETALLEELSRTPQDPQLRFELGILEFIFSVEGLAQDLYRYGLREGAGFGNNIPILRLPIPENAKPSEINYQQFRAIFERFNKKVAVAEKNLAQATGDKIRIPLRLAPIKLDIDNDGKPETDFRVILNRYFGGNQGRGNPLGDFRITFDEGDAIWLRGYCNLLMGMTTFLLAYDFQESFEVGACLLFPKVKTPHEFLNLVSRKRGGFFPDDIVDVIAFVHSFKFSLKDAAKTKESLAHFEKVIALSRDSWKAILAETDDENEWIPNPKQKGVLSIPINRQMINGWMEFLEEAENILQGKVLLPFWREGEPRGVNLRKVFTEPRQVDFIFWFQGTAATPYLEKGPITSPIRWQMLQRLFGGEFVGFAFWFN